MRTSGRAIRVGRLAIQVCYESQPDGISNNTSQVDARANSSCQLSGFTSLKPCRSIRTYTSMLSKQTNKRGMLQQSGLGTSYSLLLGSALGKQLSVQ